MDKLCYGKSSGAQERLPRFVYAHQGRNRDNPHSHFLAKGDGGVRAFYILMNALCASMEHVGGAIADQNEILPAISKKRAAAYIMHENHGYDLSGFCEKLTHLPIDASAMRDNAATLLRSAANRFQHLNDERLPLISMLNVLSSDTSDVTQSNWRSYCGEMMRPLDMTMC